jgi:site-specific recombinase XerD
MPKLLDEVRDSIRVRHYSIRTEEAYVRWIKEYIFFHKKRHPAEMAEREVSDFLSHLAVKRKVAASTQTQALSALLFLIATVKQPLGSLNDIERAKKPSRQKQLAGDRN